MSVRESDEERKKKCSGSQLGIVAAAVGVGVGAALYYFLSKRPEHPDGEGSTSSRWTCEEPQAFRKRSWSLEECSICCEIMLKDQDVKTLACSHNFHTACVAPWLEEQQTCPNCRKQA